MQKRKQKRKKEVRRARYGDIAYIILKVVGVAGLLSVALVAPNALRMFTLFENKKWDRKYDFKYYVSRRVRGLQKRGLIKTSFKNGKEYLQLTPKGEKELERFRNKAGDNRGKKWDGKWRVVMYDVYEKNRTKRDHLRTELVEAGFKQLQKSVWVSPFEAEDFHLLLKTDLNLNRAVLYMTVENIEDDLQLRKMFNLKSR